MPELESIHLNKHLCFALYTASHAYVDAYSERLSEVGLSYEQYLVMVLLWQHQQLSIEELAGKLHLGLITLNNIVKSIEKAGLVIRTRGNQNDRTVVVALTGLGSEIQHKVCQIQQKMKCETGLTQLEHSELSEKLEKLLDHLKTRIQHTEQRVEDLPADL